MTTFLELRTELSARLNANVWTDAEKKYAINAAIRDAYPAWFTEVMAEELVVCEDQQTYDLLVMRKLLGVYLEQPDEYITGTATGGTYTELADTSQNWDDNAYAWWHVTIYGGTGKGSYALIDHSEANKVYFSETGKYWNTSGTDTTSKYMLKNEIESTDYTQILAYSVDKESNPTKLYLKAQYTPGFYLRLHYIIEPEELVEDTDETDVPAEYIVNSAAAMLWLWRMGKAPGNEIEPAQNLATMFKGLADKYKAEHGMRWPTETMRTERETRGAYTPADWPF
jgi:hypothetical protein